MREVWIWCLAKRDFSIQSDSSHRQGEGDDIRTGTITDLEGRRHLVLDLLLDGQAIVRLVTLGSGDPDQAGARGDTPLHSGDDVCGVGVGIEDTSIFVDVRAGDHQSRCAPHRVRDVRLVGHRWFDPLQARIDLVIGPRREVIAVDFRWPGHVIGITYETSNCLRRCAREDALNRLDITHHDVEVPRPIAARWRARDADAITIRVRRFDRVEGAVVIPVIITRERPQLTAIGREQFHIPVNHGRGDHARVELGVLVRGDNEIAREALEQGLISEHLARRDGRRRDDVGADAHDSRGGAVWLDLDDVAPWLVRCEQQITRSVRVHEPLEQGLADGIANHDATGAAGGRCELYRFATGQLELVELRRGRRVEVDCIGRVL